MQTHQTTSGVGSGTQRALVKSETRFSGEKFLVHETLLSYSIILISLHIVLSINSTNENEMYDIQ